MLPNYLTACKQDIATLKEVDVLLNQAKTLVSKGFELIKQGELVTTQAKKLLDNVKI